MINQSKIGGVILAGGRASRMDFVDKPLQSLLGRPLLEHSILKAAPQVAQLLLSINHSIESYSAFGLPIVRDHDRNYGGPLLGILSAMHWYRGSSDHKDINYLACFPADVPLFPTDVIQRLATELDRRLSDVAYIVHGSQIQPLFSLWRLDAMEQVEVAVATGIAGPKFLFGYLDAVAVQHDDNSPGIFDNINSFEDLEIASQRLSNS